MNSLNRRVSVPSQQATAKCANGSSPHTPTTVGDKFGWESPGWEKFVTYWRTPVPNTKQLKLHQHMDGNGPVKQPATGPVRVGTNAAAFKAQLGQPSNPQDLTYHLPLDNIHSDFPCVATTLNAHEKTYKNMPEVEIESFGDLLGVEL